VFFPRVAGSCRCEVRSEVEVVEWETNLRKVQGGEKKEMGDNFELEADEVETEHE